MLIHMRPSKTKVQFPQAANHCNIAVDRDRHRRGTDSRMAQSPPMVFVVDDDTSVCKALSRLLRAAGWAVRSFQSAEQFLACEREAGAGCLVLDIRMPGMDGLALQRHLQETDPDLPIVFITGQDEDESHEEALAHGAVAVIQKPLDEEALLTSIESGLARTQGLQRQQEA